MILVLVLGLVLITVIYGVVLYNALVQLKHEVSKSWANIDVLLKQRHDELPKLVEVCRQYKEFEQSTLARVIDARGRVAAAQEGRDMAALGQAEAALRQSVGRIFAVVEAYPELKSNERFAQLQTRITALENAIADRRELYNEAANINNVRVEQLPYSLIARHYGFGQQPLLEFAAEEKSDVDVRALFAS